MLNVKSDRGDVHVEIEGALVDIIGDFGCAVTSIIQGLMEGKNDEQKEFIERSIQTAYMLAMLRAKQRTK